MGFWKTALRVGTAVVTIGGSEVTEAQKRRHQQVAAQYNRLRDEITQHDSDFRAVKASIEKQVRTATRKLRQAVRILHPVGRGRVRPTCASATATSGNALMVKSTSVPAARTPATYSGIPALIGAGVGAGSSVALWSTVQALGHASTGTFMGGIYGAAASNAGWAWFGGGSLATGGGGMAAGHLLLPGLGSAIAVAVSTTLSYREASRIAKLCREIESVNAQNALALTKWQSDLGTIRALETKLRREGDLLAEEIRVARKSFLRFGLFSHIGRLLRYWIRGYYYTANEQPVLERLDRVAARFVETFR